MCLVDNQENYYEQLGRLGFAAQIGIRTFAGAWEINVEVIRDLLGCQKKRDDLKQSILGLIDLKGASRVIDFLVQFNANRF